MHGRITIPKCDLLIHSGDACGGGTVQEMASFANWFSSLDQATHKIYVPGNHDLAVENSYDICRGMFRGPNMHVLVNQGCQIEGMNFWGTPYTPEFCGWGFQGDDGGSPRFPSLKQIYGMIPDNTDVLICHGPPRGVRDETYDGDSVGSQFMRDRLANLRIKLYVCGHIHYSYGISKLQNTGILVNAALADDFDYELMKDPISVVVP
jgi:Icc-related predicted phosphoesterase